MRERRPWGDTAVSDMVGTMLMVAVVVVLGTSVAVVVTSTISSTTVPAAAMQLGALRSGDTAVSIVLTDGDAIPLSELRILLERAGGEPAIVASATWTTPDATSWRTGDRLSFPVSPAIADGEQIRVRVVRSESQIAAMAARVGTASALAGTATLDDLEVTYPDPSEPSVLADGVAAALVTARVSHPGGVGAVSSVVADLSDLTGTPGQTLELNDAGIDGDVAGGDGVWSALVRAPATSTIGSHDITLTAIDLAGATSATTVAQIVVQNSLAQLAEDVEVLDGSESLGINSLALTAPATMAAGGTASVTLDLQDNRGGPMATLAGMTVTLATNSTLGYFLPDGSNVPTRTVDIAPGAGSATFRYVDHRSGGASVITAYAPGNTSGSATIEVTGRTARGIPDHLVFTTAPASVAAGVASTDLTLTLYDANDEVVTPVAPLTIRLASSTLGSSFLDATTGASIDSLTLSGSTASFRYLDAGYQSAATLTAFAEDTIPAFAHVTVTGATAPDRRLVLSGVPSSVVSGAASATTLTITLRDHLGSVSTTASPMTVTLSTNSTIGYFLSGGSVVRTVTIPAGASSTTVDYVDYRSGGASHLSAFADGVAPASATLPVTGRSGKGIPDHLEFTSVPTTLASRTTSQTLTLTLRDSNNETVTPPRTLTILLVSNTLGSYFVDATTGVIIQTINMSTSESSVSFKYYDAGYQSLSAITAFANDTIPAFAQIPITGYGSLPITFYGTCSGCTVTGGSILFEGDRLSVPASSAVTGFRIKNWTYDRSAPSRVAGDALAARIIGGGWGWSMYFQFSAVGGIPGINKITMWNANATTVYEPTGGATSQVSIVDLDLNMADLPGAGFTCSTTLSSATGCTTPMTYRNADIRGSPAFILSFLRDEANNRNSPTDIGMFGVDVVVSS